MPWISSSHNYFLQTGKCICRAGFYGPLCKRRCPIGFYGPSCAKKCQCAEGLRCDAVTGDCAKKCPPGYTGELCDKAIVLHGAVVAVCAPGTYGYDCEQRCECSEPGQPKACHHVTGTCSCLPGLTGVMCDTPCPSGLYGPNCAFECACQNGAECNAKDGSCICPPGFYGASCSEVCPSGRYGTDCMKLCDCQNGAICSPDCLKRCDCADGMHCDPSDGECICPPGKRGAKCDQDCEPGRFGAGCRGICACSNGASCDGVSGACTCTPGWRGKRCDRPCPDGRYGEECRFICDCATSNDTTLYNPFVARCDHVTGDCRCPPGWTGPDCATPCPPGRWGSGCNSECECANGATCDRLTGFCDCPAGFMGKNCETDANGLVPPAILEQTARKSVSAKMELRVTQLVDTAPVKLVGEGENAIDVSTLYAPKGPLERVAGRNANAKRTPIVIQLTANASVNQATSAMTARACKCAPGFTGLTCNQVCPEGRWGPGCKDKCRCANGAHCDPTTGECKCNLGYMGTTCEQSCPSGKYGLNCTLDCECHGNARCDPVQGCCDCPPGRYGTRCQFAAPFQFALLDFMVGTVASRVRAKTVPLVSQETGSVSVLLGLKEIIIVIVCRQGRYGENCQHKCQCYNGATCDRKTGRCSCAPGYLGPTCQHEMRGMFYQRA
ncbi:EGF-like domain protein [Ancylostoma ceylanicum]|uniref:EGF-like domain protein n=1 Tax=Ancylostoma ceylanicum TaxID=53326 RepID=A0A0D6LQZ7_9BILA|nr:EGF-like domain protein [Ancylostoma ceylanicum]